MWKVGCQVRELSLVTTYEGSIVLDSDMTTAVKRTTSDRGHLVCISNRIRAFYFENHKVSPLQLDFSVSAACIYIIPVVFWSAIWKGIYFAKAV